MIVEVTHRTNQYVAYDEYGDEISNCFDSHLGNVKLCDYSCSLIVFVSVGVPGSKWYRVYDENFREISNTFDYNVGEVIRVIGDYIVCRKVNAIKTYDRFFNLVGTRYV